MPDEDEEDTWGGRIRARRYELGFTQAQLAEASGITQQMISRIENLHEVPRWRTLARLAEALKTTIEELDP